MNRRLVILIVGPLLALLGVTAAWAYWSTTGTGTASASTGTLNAPTSPTASTTAGSGTVNVNWTLSTASASGLSPSGYYVTRIQNSTGATSNACSTSPSQLTTSAACADLAVADGSYHYVVTAVKASWTASSTASNNVTVVNDNTPPSVTINQAFGQADPTNSGTVAFTATFSEPVTGFTGAAVTLGGTSGGTKTVAVSGTTDPVIYTVTVSGATGNGTVTATIGAGKVTDLAGNANTASTSTDNTVTLDTTAPTVTINQAGGQADPTKSGTVVFTATFTEAVTGFASSSVTAGGTSGGTKTVVVSGTGPSYTVTVSGATGDGTVTATIAAGAAADAAGNASTASSSTDNTVTLDTTAPTVTINQAAGQLDPTNSGTVAFTATFTEPVTGFASSSVTAGGTAGGTRTVAVTGSGSSYTVTVSGATGNGTVTATIAAGAATDAVGNVSAGSTSTDNTVTLDTTGPSVKSVLLANGKTAGQADSGNTVTIEYSEQMDASKFCSTWFNSGTQVLGGASGAKDDVIVTIANSGTNDLLTVSVSPCAGLNIGSVALGGDYVSATTTFKGAGSNASLVSLTTAGVLTIKLGTGTGSLLTVPSSASPSYTPATGLTDLAGNGLGTTTFVGTSSRF